MSQVDTADHYGTRLKRGPQQLNTRFRDPCKGEHPYRVNPQRFTTNCVEIGKSKNGAGIQRAVDGLKFGQELLAYQRQFVNPIQCPRDSRGSRFMPGYQESHQFVAQLQVSQGLTGFVTGRHEQSEDIGPGRVWMGSTLGDLIVYELVYLLSVTNEAAPWSQWPKILTEHRKIQEAYSQWITDSIEHLSHKPLESLISRPLVQAKDRPQDHAHRNPLHRLPHGEHVPSDQLAHHLLSDVSNELSVRTHLFSMKGGH